MNRDSDNINQNILLERYIELLTNNNEHISNILTYIRNSEELMRMLVRLNRSQIFPENNNITNPSVIPRNIRNDTVNPLRRQWSRVFQQPNLNSLFENLTPVTVAPTSQQIMNATTVDFFRNFMLPINSICPITQQPFNLSDPVLKINHCGHIFTLSSIQEWFRRNVRCPVCRHDVREIVNETNTNTNTQNIDIISNNRTPTYNESNTNDNTNDNINTSISDTHTNIANSLSNLTQHFNMDENTEIDTSENNSVQVESPRIPDPHISNNIDDNDAPEPLSESVSPNLNNNQQHQIPEGFRRELRRNLLASLADSLNSELEREIRSNNSNELNSENEFMQYDNSGNLTYSFSLNSNI